MGAAPILALTSPPMIFTMPGLSPAGNMGELLHHHTTDHQRNIVRYRASASIFNGCHRKSDCTDSDDGREIERRVNSWVQSEIHHFHRGITLALLLLATLILAFQLIWYSQPRDLILIGVPLAIMSLVNIRLAKGFVAKAGGDTWKP